MDQINKYKRVEEDQLQGKGKEKAIPQKGRDFKSDQYNNNSPRRDFAGQYGSTNSQKVNAVFNEPFFKWPNKMVRDSMKRNQSLYCQYHQDHGHTTEDYRNLWNHLYQLV